MLWHVLGHWLDVPIYRLLGGKFRDKVRIYADRHGGEALEALTRCSSRPASWESKDPKNHNHSARNYYGEWREEPPASPDDYDRQALKKKAEGFTPLSLIWTCRVQKLLILTIECSAIGLSITCESDWRGSRRGREGYGHCGRLPLEV